MDIKKVIVFTTVTIMIIITIISGVVFYISLFIKKPSQKKLGVIALLMVLSGLYNIVNFILTHPID